MTVIVPGAGNALKELYDLVGETRSYKLPQRREQSCDLLKELPKFVNPPVLTSSFFNEIISREDEALVRCRC